MRRQTRRRLAWAVAAALGSAGPADAFFWAGWPGSELSTPRTLVPAGDTPAFPPNPSADPRVPPSDAPPWPTPGGPPTGGPPSDVPSPEHVPEPATGVAVLVGLGALAARRLRRA